MTGKILAALRRAPRPPLPLFVANDPPPPSSEKDADGGDPAPDPGR
ncbi:MAG: hypothetical protein ACE5H3_00155 [Planctomycetota bacterium]